MYLTDTSDRKPINLLYYLLFLREKFDHGQHRSEFGL